MATVQQFKEQIATEFMAMTSVKRLYNLDETKTFEQCFSAVSIESIFLYIWAFGAWVITSLFDKHRTDVLAALAELKPHSIRWYTTKAKAYQHGDELPKDESNQVSSDVYSNIVEFKKIVRFAVARELEGVVLLKVAKYTASENHTPCKLTDEELIGLRRYFQHVKDAGVPMAIISNAPDIMSIAMTIYYNPMQLQVNDGVLVDENGDNVVRRAIEQVIENLPFNGDCRNSDILDAVKSLDGVDVADIESVKTKPAGGVYKPVVGYCTPDSGYFKLETLTLTLKPYSYGNEL